MGILVWKVPTHASARGPHLCPDRSAAPRGRDPLPAAAAQGTGPWGLYVLETLHQDALGSCTQRMSDRIITAKLPAGAGLLLSFLPGNTAELCSWPQATPGPWPDPRKVKGGWGNESPSRAPPQARATAVMGQVREEGPACQGAEDNELGAGQNPSWEDPCEPASKSPVNFTYKI